MGPKLAGNKRGKETPSRTKAGDDMDTDGPPSILRKSSVRKPKDPTSSPIKKKTNIARGRSVESAGRASSASRSKTPVGGIRRSQTPSSKRSATPKGTKKTLSKPSFADKLKTPPSPKKPLKRLKYRKFVSGVMSMPRSSSLRLDVYRKAGEMLKLLQAVHGGKTTRILNHNDINEKPLSSATQMPIQHVDVEKYIYFDVLKRFWNGETIPNGKTRRIEFNCLLESDVAIEDLVEAVEIDLIDLQIQLSVKTCQAIRHEGKMHLLYVFNKYNRGQVERDLQSQLEQLQKDYHMQDKQSFLGKFEEAGRPFPKLSVKLDYAYNGPFEKKKDGVDTRFKRVFVIEYALADKVHVEEAVKLYKKSGRLSAYWGEHANIQIAPIKDPEITASTTLEKWHSILDSHSATMLSSGLVRLEGIKNPDVPVKVEYWKSSSKPRPDKMTLRDVLHSIKVSGTEREAQVFHGLCRSPDGGFEAAVADTNPIAKAQGRNVATHPAGWILGYITNKGWKKACIEEFMKKSFTTSAIVSAQKSTWDKKSGQVTSDDLDEIDQELRNVQDSWVDMSLLTAASGNENVQNAALDSGDMAAFDWEAGASVKTMNSNGVETNSDNDGSLVNSSDDEEEYEHSDEEGAQQEGEEENSHEEDNEDDEDGYWTEASKAEWPIRELFKENVELRDNLVASLKKGELSTWYIRLANRYNDLGEEEAEIDEKIIDLVASETGGEENEDFEEQREMLDFRLVEIEGEKEEIKQQLQEALKDYLVRDEEGDGSVQHKNSVGFSTDSVAGQEELKEFQDAQEAETQGQEDETHSSQRDSQMHVDEDPQQDTAQSDAGREPG